MYFSLYLASLIRCFSTVLFTFDLSVFVVSSQIWVIFASAFLDLVLQLFIYTIKPLHHAVHCCTMPASHPGHVIVFSSVVGFQLGQRCYVSWLHV
jgi:hypothetical protein